MFNRTATRATVRGLVLTLVIGTLGVACSGSDSDSRDRNVSSTAKAMTCTKAGQVKNVGGKKMVCGQSTMAKKSPKQWFPVAAQKKWVCKKPGIPRYQNGMLSICGTVKKKTFWHTIVQAQASALATPSATTISPAATVAPAPTDTSTVNTIGSAANSPVVRESGTGPAPTTSTSLPATTTTQAPAPPPGPTTTLGPLEIVTSHVPSRPRVGDEVWFGARAGCDVEQFKWRVDSAKYNPHSGSATHQPFSPSQPETYKVKVYGTCRNGEFAGREVANTFDLPVLAAARPANDNIADATILSGETGTTRSTTLGASLEIGEPKHTSCENEADVSVWHRWSVPKSGKASITHTPQNPWRAGGLVLYSGTTFETLERVPTVTSPDWRSQTFDAVNGVTYSIVATGCHRGSFGAFDLRWDVKPQSTGDNPTTTSPTTTSPTPTSAAPSSAPNIIAPNTTSPNTTVPAPAPSLKVGDTGPGGGIVFLTPSSEGNLTGKYFEAAPVTWYAPFDAGGVTAPTLAASMEYGGLKDWVLPSINELRALYAMRSKASCKTKCATSFGTGVYWSSTVEQGKQPLTVNFTTQGSLAGAVTELDRTSGAFIRAIRSFS